MCGCLLHVPYWGPGLQPRHVPWLEIEPATLWFTGQHSIHWEYSIFGESVWSKSCVLIVYEIVFYFSWLFLVAAPTGVGLKYRKEFQWQGWLWGRNWRVVMDEGIWMVEFRLQFYRSLDVYTPPPSRTSRIFLGSTKQALEF